jgi:nitroreductase
MRPGLYRWPDLSAPLRSGTLRDAAWIVCWEQDVCRDASAVVVAATDLDAIDDRGYRDAQIDAGIACGRLQLAATALGLGATGMTFIDSELPAFLGSPLAGLILTCLGVAPHRTKRAGTPRHPTDVSER